MSMIDPRFSRLYRDAATEGPPPAVDSAILAAARQRVAKPKRRKHQWWSRWMVPASLMATLVLGVSITLLIERDHPEIVQGEISRQDSPQPITPLPSISASSPASTKAKTAAEFKSKALLASPPSPPAESRPATPSAAEIFPAERRAKAVESKVLQESNVAGDREVRLDAVVAPAAKMSAPMRIQAPPRSPESWLDDIRRLKREGRDKDAAEQLVEFRRAYPGIELPDDLPR